MDVRGAGQARAERRMLESEAKALLATFGISVPRGISASDPHEASARSRGLRFPVVAKVLSPDLLHKTDVGAVTLGLQSPEMVEQASAQMLRSVREHLPGARIEGVLVEEAVPPGVEVLVGVIDDEVFGKLLGFGLGGVYAEAYGDVGFRALPLRPWDIEELLEDVRGARVLREFRGRTPNREGLTRLLLRLAGADGLVTRLGEALVELELNPIVVGEREVVVLDAKLAVTEGSLKP